MSSDISLNDTSPLVKADRAFVDYSIKNFLQHPDDIKFISNRRLLPRLQNETCDSLLWQVSDILITGETCSIQIKLKPFAERSHTITKIKNGDFKKVDGLFPYGGEFGTPDYEIELLSIRLNEKLLLIPPKAYQNLFRPRICIGSLHRRPQAYTSMDGQFIYVYLYGGEGAGTYFVKFVFNKKQYLTKIVADYYSLSTHAAFRDNFIGY